MKKALFLLTISLLTALQLGAVPAKRGFTKFVQSDGTAIMVSTIGDEYYHYTVTSDGYSVVSGDDGDLYYATAKNGYLIASKVKVKATLNAAERVVASQSLGIRPARQTALADTRETAERAAWRAPAKAAQQFGIWGGEVKGSMKGLVILVNFADTKYVVDSPKEAFNEMLNTTGYSQNGGTGSARDYFIDNSSGLFNPEFDVYGPYDLPNKSKYYAGNSGTDNGGQLIIDACKLADDDVDFSQYSTDGKVNSVFVYYAGYNQAEYSSNNSLVWPHQSSVEYRNINLDGVRLADYACTSELSGSFGKTMAGIGTFCHEFGHVMGLPDFYDTDGASNGSAFGLDVTSVMDYGSYINDGRTPPAYNIIERWMVGWGEPEVISSTGTYTLAPVYENTGYRINTENEDEYFLLENRSIEAGDKWDHYLLHGDDAFSGGGGGMLVYHIDYTQPYRSRWSSNKINSHSGHECIRFVRAVNVLANTYAKLGNTKKWYFPGSANITALNGTTTPKLVSWGSIEPECVIDEISEDAENIILRVSTDAEQIVSEVSIEPSLNGAVITWKATAEPAVAQWHVTVTSSSLINPISINTAQMTVTLDGLSPATTYNVLIAEDGNSKGYAVNFTTLDPVSDITADARQYDALISWKSEVGSAMWTIEYAPKSESTTNSVMSMETFCLLDNLKPATAYIATIRHSASDKGYKVEFITGQANGQNRSRLNIDYTQEVDNYVRLSISDLHTTPSGIAWYVDSRKVSSSYLQLAAGEHTVCAVITSDGNTEYLFRYINVTK